MLQESPTTKQERLKYFSHERKIFYQKAQSVITKCFDIVKLVLSEIT